jgi:hypothetical protein
MNEERTRKCLRQVEHIRGHLWHKYSITVTQVIVAWITTVVTSSYCFKMTQLFILFLILDLINWNLSSPPFFGGVRVARSWLSWSHQFQCFTVATMTWVTVMEYLCHRWPRICSTCRKHFLVLSSFMTVPVN